MTVEQAYQVLGLKLGCTEKEIVQAHKRLMIKVHPDKGGSNFLAAQLNRAKSVLLDK
jgi:curved DNA-binding protein CbpA